MIKALGQHQPCRRPCMASASRPRLVPCRASPGPSHAHRAATAPNQKAIVIGSGISGLLAAETLSKHFGTVVVVEGDAQLPVWEHGSAIDMVRARGARRGVTQYNHIHGLAAGGLQSINSIFQGRYIPALEEAGGVIVNPFTAVKMVHPKHGMWPLNTAAKPMQSAFCTRHVFEMTARHLVEDNAAVSFMYGCQAVGLQFGDSSSAAGGEGGSGERKAIVTGVELADGSILAADLVVDASGRHSRVPDWLAAAGYTKPRVSDVTAGCGYAGWFAKLDPDIDQQLSDAGVHAIYFLGQPSAITTSLMVRVEGGCWQVSVGGYQGKHPPFKDEQLLEFAIKELWHPAVGQLLAGSQQLTPASRFYHVRNTWRHFEEVELPEGLLPLADSICSFSPVYGQGMTVAGLEVVALDRLLTQRRTSVTEAAVPLLSNASSSSTISSSTAVTSSSSTHATGSHASGSEWLTGLNHEFLLAIQPLIEQAWGAAAGNDMKFEGATSTDQPPTGAAAVVGRMMDGYMTSLFDLAAHDATVNEALTRVMQMVDEPQKILQPALVARVLLHQMTAPLVGVLRSSGSSSSNSAGGGPVGHGTAYTGRPKLDLGL